MGPTTCYFQNQVMSVCQSFRPIVPFFFLVKVPFLALFEYKKAERGVTI